MERKQPIDAFAAARPTDFPFLLLTGYEPDFQWEAFTSDVLGLIDTFQVKTTTWMNSMPMPVPHSSTARGYSPCATRSATAMATSG